MFVLLSVLRLDEQIPFGDMSACRANARLQRHRSRRSATCRSILFGTFSFTLKEKVHKGVLALSREKRGVLKEKVRLRRCGAKISRRENPRKIFKNPLTNRDFDDTIRQYKEEKRSAFTVRQCLYGQ